jgi:hypothetical protein
MQCAEKSIPVNERDHENIGTTASRNGGNQHLSPECSAGPALVVGEAFVIQRTGSAPNPTLIWSRAVSVNFNIPYSAQYNTTNREGHEHPPPAFSAPTLVWHLAISPHWPEKDRTNDAALKDIHADLAQTYEDTRAAFFQEINRLLEALQAAAGFPTGRPQVFNARHVSAPWQTWKGLGDPFYVVRPGSIRFTLWWKDDDTKPNPDPTADALRVKVYAAAHRDYVTLSFYLDASKSWNQVGIATSGERRGRILSAVDSVRTICERRMAADAQGIRPIDREVLPEHDVSGADAATLMGASRYLYAELWDEFCKAMKTNNIATLQMCRVFANFRGLVMPTEGLPEAIEQRKFPGSSGAEPFPRFKGNGGIDHTGTRSSTEPNEANAVVKAFWPFIRRVTRDADRKEFVACGVMAWRALYVTSLNSPPSYEWQEEARSADTEIPEDQLPEASNFPAPGPKGEVPVHYLLITKGEPHRRQVGRIIERINSMGTMRLIALRDFGIIRDASTQIQLRGLELDRIMNKWSRESTRVRDRYRNLKLGTKKKQKKDELQDREDDELQDLANSVESDLIYLSAALDEVGVKAVHGLHFRINRSRYYVCEFESLLASLKIGNIDTWVSYDQFVTRGLKPAFDFIDGVGTRLVGLRSRLQTVLEGIETSALVIQTSRTRANTAELRKIARRFTLNNLIGTALGLILTLLTAILGLGFRQQIGQTLKEVFKWLFGSQ